jgi:hypothetical protein
MFKKTLRNHLTDISLFAVLFVLSLWIRRFSWGMYYLTLPYLGYIGSFLKPDSKRGVFIGGTLLFTLSLVLVLILKMPYSQYTTMNWNTYCSMSGYCSSSSAEALRTYYVPGKTYTTYNLGGWMIWNHPDMKPAIDGRMHLWQDKNGYSGFLYTYLFEWDKKSIDTSKYDVAYVSTDKPVYDRLLRLTAAKRWNQVYRDSTNAIFVRNK